MLDLDVAKTVEPKSFERPQTTPRPKLMLGIPAVFRKLPSKRKRVQDNGKLFTHASTKLLYYEVRGGIFMLRFTFSRFQSLQQILLKRAHLQLNLRFR